MRDFKILIPEVIADGVSHEHADKLLSLAGHFYKTNKRWAVKVTDDGKGRDFLWEFMQHWMDGYAKTGRWIDERRKS